MDKEWRLKITRSKEELVAALNNIELTKNGVIFDIIFNQKEETYTIVYYIMKEYLSW